MGRTLFIEEAAALLGVSRRTVYYRIREGRLQTIRTRCGSQRVLLASIEALLREEVEKRRSRDAVADGQHAGVDVQVGVALDLVADPD